MIGAAQHCDVMPLAAPAKCWSVGLDNIFETICHLHRARYSAFLLLECDGIGYLCDSLFASATSHREAQLDMIAGPIPGASSDDFWSDSAWADWEARYAAADAQCISVDAAIARFRVRDEAKCLKTEKMS